MPVDELSLPTLTAKDMPYVSFERGEPKEDKKESLKQKRPVYKDVYYACITSPGSKDRLKEALPEWWDKLDAQVKSGRMPAEWVAKWRAAYERFMQGLAIPEDGTPILGWNLIPPSIQRTLIDLNIRTVEALAHLTDEARHHIGMGALEMQRRAQAWLAQHQDKGPLAIEMAAVQHENATLKTAVAELEEKVKLLAAQLEADGTKRGPGRPRKEADIS